MSSSRQITDTLIHYLEAHDLLDSLPQVIAVLEQKAAELNQIKVAAASQLSVEEENQLREALFKKWGEHPISFEHQPELLSGMRITFHDHILDTSGKTKLSTLAEQLTT